MTLGGGLTPVLQSKRVFSTFSNNSKGYPCVRVCVCAGGGYVWFVCFSFFPVFFYLFLRAPHFCVCTLTWTTAPKLELDYAQSCASIRRSLLVFFFFLGGGGGGVIFIIFFNVGAECWKLPSWPMNLFFVSFIAGAWPDRLCANTALHNVIVLSCTSLWTASQRLLIAEGLLDSGSQLVV